MKTEQTMDAAVIKGLVESWPIAKTAELIELLSRSLRQKQQKAARKKGGRS